MPSYGTHPERDPVRHNRETVSETCDASHRYYPLSLPDYPTFIQPLLWLGDYQGHVVRGILEDVYGRGVRQALQVHIIHRDETIPCGNTHTHAHQSMTLDTTPLIKC